MRPPKSGQPGYKRVGTALIAPVIGTPITDTLHSQSTVRTQRLLRLRGPTYLPGDILRTPSFSFSLSLCVCVCVSLSLYTYIYIFMYKPCKPQCGSLQTPIWSLNVRSPVPRPFLPPPGRPPLCQLLLRQARAAAAEGPGLGRAGNFLVSMLFTGSFSDHFHFGCFS